MMRENLPCSVVRDLLPAYVEHLTDEETARLVKSHLKDCRECSELCRAMSGEEPVTVNEQAEVDYLRKVRRSRKRLILAAACLALLLVGAALFILLRPKSGTGQIIQAAMPEWTFDEETKTLVVYGTDDYLRMELPDSVNRAVNLEVQDDNYHLSVFLPVLQNKTEPLQAYLPGFIGRTDQSLAFLRAYLKEHAGSAYSAKNAEKFVELNIRRKGGYEYTIDEDRLTLEVGDFYWHRDTLYLLALLDFRDIQWQQLGYVFYVGSILNPYAEQKKTSPDNGMEAMPYYDVYLALGGQRDGSAEDYRRLHDAVSWYCIHKGCGNWGTAYESSPVTEFAWYTGPKKAVAGNDMTPAMATSLIAWLTDRYGFETVSEFCLGQKSFNEAFDTDFASARVDWEAWLSEAAEAGKQ